MTTRPEPSVLYRNTGDPDDAWNEATGNTFLAPSLDFETCCVCGCASAITRTLYEPTLGRLQAMFEAEDVGGLWNFVDTGGLYQNSIATIAPSVGSPVGMMLDFARGVPEPRRNLITYSETLSHASWIRAGLTLANDIAVTPTTRSGFTLTADEGNSIHRATSQTNINSPSGNSGFIIAKEGTSRYINIGSGGEASSFAALFDLRSGVLIAEHGSGTYSSLGAGVKSLGDGWFLCWASGTTSGSYGWGIQIAPDDTPLNGLQRWPAIGTETILFAATQYESVPVCTDYQPVFEYPLAWENNLKAIQATTANKPTLRQTPTTNRYWLEAIDAARALDVTFASAPGTMYTGRVTPTGVVWATETWDAATKNLIAQGAYNAGVIARDRAFSDGEKALVERYFSYQLPADGEVV